MSDSVLRPATHPAPSPTVIDSWRMLMTVVARSLDVAVGLVTRDTNDGHIEMTAPSLTEDCPYLPGALHDLSPGLLCERVIRTRSDLVVGDARNSREWRDNPDVSLGLVAYLGYPVLWPDGEVFGTVCVLDSRPRDFTAADRALLLSARDAIHDSLLAGLGLARGERAPSDAGEASGPFGTWDLDPASGRLRLSPALVRSFRLFHTDELVLDDWLSRFPSVARERIATAVGRVASGQWRTATTSALIPMPDGSEVVRLAARGVPGDGRVLTVVGIQTSVRVATVQRMREERLPSPSHADAVLEVDVDGRVSRISETMRSAVGFPQDVCGLTLADAFGGMYDGGAAVESLRRALAEDVLDEVTLLQACPNEASHVAVVDTLHDAVGRRTGCRLTLVPDVYEPASVPPPVRDSVTGLPTRLAFERRLEAELGRIDAPGDRAVLTLTVVEVTNIDEIVRAHGHRVADAYLVRLGDGLRSADRFLAALGLGYFAILAWSHDGEPAVTKLPARVTSPLGTGQGAGRGSGSGSRRVEPRLMIASAPVHAVGARSAGEVVAAVIARLVPSSTNQARLAGLLTAREREIARLVAAGMTNREIAETLFIAVRTVEGHLDRVREKLSVTSRTQLVARVIKEPELLRS